MQKKDEAEELDLSEKYKLEYVTALAEGCFETHRKESGCYHSYDTN